MVIVKGGRKVRRQGGETEMKKVKKNVKWQNNWGGNGDEGNKWWEEEIKWEDRKGRKREEEGKGGGADGAFGGWGLGGWGPTCDLEGDGEEGGDTRLLLSLGLTSCNYRAKDTAISYTRMHTHTRRGFTRLTHRKNRRQGNGHKASAAAAASEKAAHTENLKKWHNIFIKTMFMDMEVLR